jgi:hypothetical protein
MYYRIVIKSDSQAVFAHNSLEDAMSAYHSELASDYLYFADGTIDHFTVMIVNQSGDIVAKEFKYRQEGA